MIKKTEDVMEALDAFHDTLDEGGLLGRKTKRSSEYRKYKQDRDKRYAAKRRDIISEIQAFTSKTNPDGSLAHPRFNELHLLMGAIMESMPHSLPSNEQEKLSLCYKLAQILADETRI